MQYRKMPNSNEELSVLGYGCMRFPTKGGNRFVSSIDVGETRKQILYAIDNGVNYLDTAYPYHRGTSESFLGEHILQNGYREKVNIATKLPTFIINNKEKIDEIFGKQLEKLKVDYIDYYLLHALDGSSWYKMKSFGVIEWMDKLKKQGEVRKMGFSFHGMHEDFIEIVDSYDWDFAQVQFNILDENLQAGIKGIDYAHKQGLGVIVMEPLRGGALVGKMPKEIKELYDKAEVKQSPAEWAFRWVYDHPAITLVLSGMNDMQHIKENIRVASDSLPNTMSETQHAVIEQVKNKYQDLLTVGCTGCEYCLPCPAGINIPGVFKNLNNYHMFGKMSPKMFHLAYHGIMTKDGKPHFTSCCTDCGECEKKCPQHIEIRQEFKHVRKDLEGPIIRGMAAVARPIMNRRKKAKGKTTDKK